MERARTGRRTNWWVLAALWIMFYASWTLRWPALLDDADSVHAEVAREMILRGDPVTLYANGIRYLEKAPLMYWAMAASMRVSQALGHTGPDALAVAARIPLALAVLALALVCEAFARRAFANSRAGLYAGLMVLSSFGFFIFSRITLPDVLVCLWIACSLLCFWRVEVEGAAPAQQRWLCWAFAASCALNVLSKGLIGVVFPLLICGLFLLLTRGLRGTWQRLHELPVWSSLAVFLLLAAPWHIAAGLANPTQGHPAAFRFIAGHWQVPLPTDGNVRGWWWFYFMNEHLLRYLNLRVPRDYDTSPLWLFWGLCAVWLMPWSAFAAHAVAGRGRTLWYRLRRRSTRRALAGGTATHLLLVLWGAVPLLFFSLSTRQEYYVLPALPAWVLLVAGWLRDANRRADTSESPGSPADAAATTLTSPSEAEAPGTLRAVAAAQRISTVLLAVGVLVAAACGWFLLHTRAPQPGTDLAMLLQQNPGDYALSMGHFLDLNATAMGLFRLPLWLTAVSVFGGTLLHWWLRRTGRPHAATLALAAGAFGFLLAAHLGLQRFAPVLSSAELARAIAPQVRPGDLVCIHGEYEAGSTLGFYLQRADVHILEGRSSNLWYGSFFPDAPRIFETPQSLAARWNGPQRIFLWQSTSDEPRDLPALPGAVFVLAKGGGKSIVSNRISP